jgi:restriction system protein
LVDGVRLAELMIEDGVGVQTKEVIRISKLDADFFSGGE